MKSPHGFAAAVVFLLALPGTLLYQVVAGAGAGAEVVVHGALALGSGLMAIAVFDFTTARWIAWAGCASAGALGVIFLLQGVGELLHNPSLTYLAFAVLGQRVEGWLVDIILLVVCCGAADG